MRDRPYLDEHSDLVTAGLLAEDVVFAAAALRAGEPVEANEARALETARNLLKYIAEADPAPLARSDIGRLAGSTGLLQTLRAAEIQAPSSDIRAFIESLVDLIDRALDDENVSAEEERLAKLQQLFARLSDFTLARANSLSLGSEDRLLWPRGTMTSIF